MPAFKEFGPGDQVDNVLILEPSYELTSGSEGWRGSPEGSGSLSLYGGARRRRGSVFSVIEYQSFAPNVGQTGNPQRSLPITASVNFVYVTPEDRPFFERSRTRWGAEHWDVLGRLYRDYSVYDPDYVTASYDYYCVYLNRDSRNVITIPPNNATGFALHPTGSFCFESWVKPFQTASATNDFTVASINRMLWFGITGSTGRLTFSSSLGAFTASVGPTVGRWSHVAVSYDSSLMTGTFLVNGAAVGTFGHTPVVPGNSYTASLTFGNRASGALSNSEAPGDPGVLRKSFHGFMGETRAWYVGRNSDQVASLMGSSLIGLAATGSYVTLRLNEGPLVDFGDSFGDFPIPSARGSGALNQASFGSFRSLTSAVGNSVMFAVLNSFSDRVGPVWHPNDNPEFTVPKRLVGHPIPGQTLFDELLVSNGTLGSDGVSPARGITQADISGMLVLAVPGAFYGRQLVPGSVRLTCRGYESFGLIRTLVDDGRGGLYLSGSAASASLEDRGSSTSVGWNKVGNVFYGEGLAVIRDPALLDFGRDDGAFVDRTSTLAAAFRGDSRIPVKTLMCRIDHGEFNCSNNPTFYVTGSAGERLARHPSGSVRATTVGIYNSDRELVAVARLADPVRIRARDRLNIRVRIDF